MRWVKTQNWCVGCWRIGWKCHGCRLSLARRAVRPSFPRVVGVASLSSWVVDRPIFRWHTSLPSSKQMRAAYDYASLGDPSRLVECNAMGTERENMGSRGSWSPLFLSESRDDLWLHYFMHKSIFMARQDTEFDSRVQASVLTLIVVLTFLERY